jgi:hypothetical protein
MPRAMRAASRGPTMPSRRGTLKNEARLIHTVGIEGAHCGLMDGRANLEWGRILGYITGTGAARLAAILAFENLANRSSHCCSHI